MGLHNICLNPVARSAGGTGALEGGRLVFCAVGVICQAIGGF